MSESIQHTGIIQEIRGNLIFVKIVQQSACAGCHAKTMCAASESKERLIEITDNTGTFHVNETVELYGKNSLGLQAVFLAFVIPVIIVLAVVAIGTSCQWNETTSGIAGISLLIPYYGILYLLRNKLKKKFVFTLKKLNQ